MKYQRFEDLPVWQTAIELGREVYTLTEDLAFKNRHSVRDQIERAAVSVSNNIAEGFERGTNQELLTFLYIARGSAGEVRSMLCLLQGMLPFRNLESAIPEFAHKDGKYFQATRSVGPVIARLRLEGPALRERESPQAGGD
jgi:four helix bundle protein